VPAVGELPGSPRSGLDWPLVVAERVQPIGTGITRARRRSLVVGDVKRLWAYRNLVRYLVSSGLATENTGTFFGLIWWLLDPLLLMLVYWFLFGVVFHRQEPYFPIYILISLISWEFFAKSVQRSMSETLERSRSMRQVAFPKSAIPVSITIAELAHLVVGIAISVFAALAAYGIVPTAALLGLIPLVAVQLMFTLGAAFIFTATNFFFRDTSHLLRYLFRAWYLLSPGIYALSRIPEQWQNIYSLNPFAGFFETFHALILHQPMPETWVIWYTIGLSVLTFVFGYALFVWVEPHFVKASG
jgi:lipopolysaccharide transport system permease protein